MNYYIYNLENTHTCIIRNQTDTVFMGEKERRREREREREGERVPYQE